MCNAPYVHPRLDSILELGRTLPIEKEVELGRQLSEYNNDCLLCVTGVPGVC